MRGSGKGDLSTGYSSYGSVGEYSVSGTVPASASQPPVASMSANPTSGVAPLAVSFSAAGSSDPDGSIVSYAWNFGDGTSASGPSASKTYTTPGTYTATLTVTDNAGLTSDRSVTITVTSPTTPTVTGTSTQILVAGVTVTLTRNKGGDPGDGTGVRGGRQPQPQQDRRRRGDRKLERCGERFGKRHHEHVGRGVD